MTKRKLALVLLSLISVLFFSGCKSSSSAISLPTLNSDETLNKPYVILVSLDGFRWDYVERFNPPFLTRFIEKGVRAESLIPSFPSKTFPNHYTIATGMYPEKHGLIGNRFYSHKKDQVYSIGNREVVEDGTFYGGIPLWIQAGRSGMVTASYFFVGSEANILGSWPTYYEKYDESIKNKERVSKVLQWLSLPVKKRPHLVTMYFSDMDDTGHLFGPNVDNELKKTLMGLDKNLESLFEGVKATGLPVDIIIVSDHGMVEVPKENYIPIDPLKNDSLYSIIDNGAIVNIHLKNRQDLGPVIDSLREKENHFKVYQTKDTPGFEYKPKNKDWGEVQVIPDFGYYFASQKNIETKIANAKTTFGVHGYDPKHQEMHGIFYANGPSFKENYTASSFKNIHIYPLVCKILGLAVPSDIDGELKFVQQMLQN
ncbi:ectonucleotide pyrophosphatase/phosphodiesterase [Maribacter sp. PR1]|uniref:Ectonucleotide pyrophosphatase/phosphodiesterase n=1 Tax=Maribacter cobaltidurans TaxID=1178778 RepID=A0ABU7IQR1_9FLAO|nr:MULTISPECIES: ectonucleotide pyrophosphatase/phosphodiesterase [Maribacter]MDC6387836.1 ectonucleotide pyrophosphatase/phosphodiesterase [Maribacter sp. PR1]MEE1975225.1 ectonucleotide pyrophosphatase/phosphodiesterase [Maribacter cobaltidurans]